MRPTQSLVKEALINTLNSYFIGNEVVWDDLKILDLFAGSGSVGFEFLSNGASSVTFVESERACLKTLKANIQALGLQDQTRVIAASLPLALKRITQKPFDLIFLDPPYLQVSRDFDLVLATITKLISGTFVKPGGLLILEYNDMSCGNALIESFSQQLELVKSKRFGDSFLFFYRVVS